MHRAHAPCTLCASYTCPMRPLRALQLPHAHSAHPGHYPTRPGCAVQLAYAHSVHLAAVLIVGNLCALYAPPYLCTLCPPGGYPSCPLCTQQLPPTAHTAPPDAPCTRPRTHREATSYHLAFFTPHNCPPSPAPRVLATRCTL